MWMVWNDGSMFNIDSAKAIFTRRERGKTIVYFADSVPGFLGQNVSELASITCRDDSHALAVLVRLQTSIQKKKRLVYIHDIK